MKTLVSTKDLSREDWLKWRKKGLGGSDAGAIAGVNPWRSAMEVYYDKTHPDEIEDRDSEAMRQGRDLEDYVAKRFEEATGKKVRRRNALLQHDTKPWMLADIDREVIGEKAVLECKTTNAWNEKEWDGEEIPPSYLVQVLHYLAVTGYDRAYIACVILGRGFEMRTIEREEYADTIAALEDIEERFWKENIEQGVMPDPDGSKAADNVIRDLYPQAEPGQEVVIEDIALDEYDRICAQIKRLTKEKGEIEETIKIEMKDAETAYIGDRRITWKNRAGSKTIDRKKLQSEMPDVYEKYLKVGKPSRVFKVQEEKEES